MVNYNNDITLATPPIDINRIQILERRAHVIEALEKYYQYKLSGTNANTQAVRSRLCSLFWELQETIVRKFPNSSNKITYEKMVSILFPDEKQSDFKDILEVWKHINLMLGEINLTKVDTKKEYDTTNIEEENRIQIL